MRDLYVFLTVTCSFYRFRSYALLPVAIFFGLPLLTAQPLPGDEQLHQTQYQSNPEYQRRMDQLENYTYTRSLTGHSTVSASRSVLTIPVVVHIMHPLGNNTPGSPGHPTNQQIENGIAWLNQAFRNTGNYAGGPFYSTVSQVGIQSVDTEIEFCLAQTAPDGSPTTGITRTATDFTDVSFNQIVSGTATEDQIMKSLAFWDANQYLNIWLVNSVCEYDNFNCNIPGYAYLPGAHGTPLDGVVLENQFFGSTPDRNEVAVYYTARYLNLWRTSYRDLNRPKCDNENCAVRGDRVCDTPPDSSLGGPVICGVMVNSCDSDSAHADSVLNPFWNMDATDLYENYMDLGETFGCKNTFTEGQKNRMRDALLTTRQSLLQQDRCSAPVVKIKLEKWLAPEKWNCSGNIIPEIQLRNTGSLPITDFQLKLSLNNQVETIDWQGSLAVGAKLILNLPAKNLAPATYTLQCEWISINGQAAGSLNPGPPPYRFWVSDPTIPAEEGSACVDWESGSLPQRWKTAELFPGVKAMVMNQSTCLQTQDYILQISNGGLPTGPAATRWALVSGPVVDPAVTPMQKLSFDWAHHFIDSLGHIKLMLLALPVGDCAEGIDTLWKATDMQLQTAFNPSSGPAADWQPQDCQDWQNKEIDLSGLILDRRQLVFAFGFGDANVVPAYIDNICWTGQRSCPEKLAIPLVQGEYKATYLCQDPDGWTHFIKETTNAKDLLLFSVKVPQGESLDIKPEELRLVVTDKPAYEMNGAPYVLREDGFFAAGRYVELLRPLEFSGEAFEVRFYFDEVQKEELALAMELEDLAPEMLIPFSIDKGVDGRPEYGQEEVLEIDYQEFLPSSLDVASGWEFALRADYYEASLYLDKLSFLGLGSGAMGKGFGARYPIPLENFKAEQKGNRHVLQWSSQREVQCAQYEILHSTDGKVFTTLATIDAKGQDSVLNHPTEYGLTYELSEQGTHYYAVQLHHQNGYTIFTDTIGERFEIGKLVRAYPNPMTSQLSISPEFEWSESLTLQLFDSRHQVFLQREWTQPGEQLTVEIPNIPTGIYFFQVQSGEVIVQGKLLKTK